MQLQLKDLKILVEIAEQQSFTKAADLLYIAQPSLSKSIQKLEKELNVTLFDRSNRKIRLTDAGMIVYKKSKEVLSTLDSMVVSLDELSDLVTGHLKIGLPQLIGTFFFPKIAREYSTKYPGVKLEIKEEGGLITEKLVEKGELDIGFVVLPVNNNDLATTIIYQDRFVLCVSTQHLLANRSSISLEDLKEESFILFSKSFTLHGLIVNACKSVGYTPNISYESTQWDLVLELVAAQQGIALVPRILATKLNDIDIVSIPIKNPSIIWNIGIVINSKSNHSFALKEFIATVKNIYLQIEE